MEKEDRSIDEHISYLETENRNLKVRLEQIKRMFRVAEDLLDRMNKMFKGKT